jgi:hypothetical protein
MKTITLTRPRLVQSQLNPAHYTTGERCCAHFATQPTKTTTTASTEAGPLPGDVGGDHALLYPAANGLDVHLVILRRLLNGRPGREAMGLLCHGVPVSSRGVGTSLHQRPYRGLGGWNREGRAPYALVSQFPHLGE